MSDWKQLGDFNSLREVLTDTDKKAIYDLLQSRLRVDTKALLWRRIHDHTTMIPHYGILSRIMKSELNGRVYWEYCAGQSYPDEIRTVRKIILECK
jgi:hypothetical protein